MPYQKIGTPVFWVDTLQYLQAMGVGGPGALTSYSEEIDGSNIFSINPASYPKKISPYDAGNGSYRRYYRWFSENLAEPIDSVSDFHPNSTSSTQSMPDIQIGSRDYVAILNHNLASTGFNKVLSALVSWGEDLDSIETALHGQNSSMIPYINYETDSTVIADGFSFFEIDVMDIAAHYFVLNFRSDEGFAFNENDTGRFPQVGCISIGKRYTMPHSPDLNLTQTYDYGVKEVETKGGASLSNNMWKNPKWGQLGAWELASVTNNVVDQNAVNLSPLARSGRKVYDLSFSYLDDGDVFGANQTLSLGDNAWSDIIPGYTYDSGDTQTVNDNVQFAKNILNDSSFFTSVIHKTNGGQLPFIFQPNSEDKTNMVIAKLDMKSFSFRQVASNLYNISLKIREVW